MEQSRRQFVALGCGVLTTGCLGVIDTDDVPTAADLEATLAELERPETMRATVETTFDREGETSTTTDVIEARADGKTYIEGTSDDATFRNTDDGERGWFYDVERNRVAVMGSERTGESHIAYIYGETERYFDELEASGLESTTLDDRDVYRVRFDPPPDETVERSITVLVGNTEYVIPLETEARDDSNGFQNSVDRIDVWFDRETLFPVKQIVETDDTDLEAIYTALTLNEPIDDERFAFEPPEDALVEEHVFPYLERYDTIEDATAAVDVSITEPAFVPDRFDRAAAAAVDYPYADALKEVSVRYASEETDGESIRVGVCNGPRPFDVTGERVTVDGTTATLAESDLGTTLEWSCDDRVYFLVATETVERDTVLAVAESIDEGCQ